MSQARTLDFEPTEECSIEEDHKRTRPQQEQMAAKAASQGLPENISNRFFESKGTYYFPDRSPAFAEKDGKLTMRTKELNPEVVKTFVSIAEDRGWSAIKVTGTKAFRQAVWLEAASRGLEVNGYTPTEVEKAWAEQKAKGHNSVMEDRDKKRDAELDFEQKRSQSAPENAAMLRSDDKSTINKNPELAKAFAGISAAKQAAKRRFQDPEQQQKFVAEVRERYAQKIEQGEKIQGPALHRSSVIQFNAVNSPQEKKAQTENERLADAMSSFSPPDPQALMKNHGGAGKLAKHLVAGGMTIGEATVAVAFNALVFSHSPNLYAQTQPKNPLRAAPEDLARHYKERMSSALAEMPEKSKAQAMSILKEHINKIDKNMLLREAQQKAAPVESPQLDGHSLDTRNPSEFSEFLRSTNISGALISRLVQERETQKLSDPVGYAKALQDEREFFEKTRKLHERERNITVAKYLVEKSERSRTDRQKEKEHTPTERNKYQERSR